jgi:hypothetical protein
MVSTYAPIHNRAWICWSVTTSEPMPNRLRGLSDIVILKVKVEILASVLVVMAFL